MRRQSQIVLPGSEPDSFEGGGLVDLNQEIVHLRADTSRKEEAGRKTKMLVKYSEFRIMLITMNAGCNGMITGPTPASLCKSSVVKSLPHAEQYV